MIRMGPFQPKIFYDFMKHAKATGPENIFLFPNINVTSALGKSTLIKFADDTTLEGAADTAEGCGQAGELSREEAVEVQQEQM